MMVMLTSSPSTNRSSTSQATLSIRGSRRRRTLNHPPPRARPLKNQAQTQSLPSPKRSQKRNQCRWPIRSPHSEILSRRLYRKIMKNRPFSAPLCGRVHLVPTLDLRQSRSQSLRRRRKKRQYRPGCKTNNQKSRRRSRTLK